MKHIMLWGFAYFLGSPWLAEVLTSFIFQVSMRHMAADTLCFIFLLCELGKLWNLKYPLEMEGIQKAEIPRTPS